MQAVKRPPCLWRFSMLKSRRLNHKICFHPSLCETCYQLIASTAYFDFPACDAASLFGLTCRWVLSPESSPYNVSPCKTPRSNKQKRQYRKKNEKLSRGLSSKIRIFSYLSCNAITARPADGISKLLWTEREPQNYKSLKRQIYLVSGVCHWV